MCIFMHIVELMFMLFNSELFVTKLTVSLEVYPVDTHGLSHGLGHGGQQLPASMASMSWCPCLITSCSIQQQSQAAWILLS